MKFNFDIKTWFSCSFIEVYSCAEFCVRLSVNPPSQIIYFDVHHFATTLYTCNSKNTAKPWERHKQKPQKSSCRDLPSGGAGKGSISCVGVLVTVNGHGKKESKLAIECKQQNTHASNADCDI